MPGRPVFSLADAQDESRVLVALREVAIRDQTAFEAIVPEGACAVEPTRDGHHEHQAPFVGCVTMPRGHEGHESREWKHPLENGQEAGPGSHAARQQKIARP